MPVGKGLNYEPGQFVFVVFGNREVGPEEHPFSISSAPGEPNIRLSIKKSGDFTSTLTKLKEGERVKLYGPYGQFGKTALTSRQDVVMIAGGIGVTPFLGVVNYVKSLGLSLNFALFYVYGNESESTYKEELAQNIGQTKRGKLITHASEVRGRITAKAIADAVGNITNKTILLCGPKGMMVALTKQFLDLGAKRRNIIFEDFDLKG
jgi:predicted ferric reductase